ncbi:MAG: hypothetical protein WCS43_08175 [Verrucomicrobiota bacterium]
MKPKATLRHYLTLGGGATFNAYNSNGANTYTTYNNLLLQGGTINGGGNWQNWGAGVLKTVTVSGPSASTISASSFFNLNGTGASSSVFDVADVTGKTPISPPSGPLQWLFQGPPAESKFLLARLSLLDSEVIV